MFRRLANMASAAVSGGASPASDENVQQLQAMGFTASQARQALHATNGNIDRAADLILSGTMTTNSPEVVDLTGDDDVRLQNALEESRQSEEQRQYQKAQEASVAQNYRSAAGNRAAQAAAQRAAAAASSTNTNAPVHLRRAQKKKPSKPATNISTTTSVPPPPRPSTNTTTATTITTKNPMKVTKTPKVGVSHHHPNVKLPAKLSDKTKEEQVLRCALRLKPYPLAVDTLYRALTAIQRDPSNVKFRKIDKTTPGYKRSLEGAPGAEALLLAMNFQTHGAYSLVLERSWVDQALLYLGISALEGTKESTEYKQGKAKLAFQQEISEIQLNTSQAEAVRRAEFMQKCPSEPTGGSGALMQVAISDETTIRRKFDGDDVLRDVLNWIGGHGSVIPDKILSREWCMVDINRFPIAPMDCELNLDKTLQYIGCWPSGRLELRPSPQAWREDGNNGQVLMGSSRGLAAAPTEAMH